jgi:hypothetical protein
MQPLAALNDFSYPELTLNNHPNQPRFCASRTPGVLAPWVCLPKQPRVQAPQGVQISQPHSAQSRAVIDANLYNRADKLRVSGVLQSLPSGFFFSAFLPLRSLSALR